VTEQPFSGIAPLTSNENEPRKGGLNIACSTVFSTGSQTRQDKYRFATVLDTDTERPPRCTALVAAELNRYNIDIATLCEINKINK